ncbi:peptidoglycan editing factor PgeF [Kaarinaea lacus]
MSIELITPDWPAPGHVHAASTTRQGGSSQPPFDSLNMAGHVGDDPVMVAANRKKLAAQLSLPDSPHWLSQIHGTEVANLDLDTMGMPEADASMTRIPGCVCAVLTADCLPVLFCDRAGTRVAAAHAGWRGLAAGVLESTVESLGVPGDQVLAWMGPAIGPRSFEVGEEVYRAFVDRDAGTAEAFSKSPQPGMKDRWYADLYQLARFRLNKVGVTEVSGGGLCTFEDAQRFYSFRRDGKTGRMASLIWMEPARR